MSGPLVSFVVVNWGAEDATARCVASIRAQEGLDHAAAEVVVVDNGSTPSSRAALGGLGVDLVPSEANLGFAGGANLGIGRTAGRFVAVVNNDAVLDAGWTRHGLEILEGDPRVGLVGGADLAWDGREPPRAPARPVVSAPRIDPRGGFATACADHRGRGDVLALNGSNLMARGDLLRRLRGFDPAFFAYYEDTDLCARVWALGRRVVYAPEMRVWHRRNLSSDRVPFRKHYLAHRNHLRLVARHFPESAWRGAVARAAAHHLVSGVTGRLSGSGAPVRGTRRRAHAAVGLWALVNGPRLRGSRRDAVRAGEHYAGFRAHAVRDAGGRGVAQA